MEKKRPQTLIQAYCLLYTNIWTLKWDYSCSKNIFRIKTLETVLAVSHFIRRGWLQVWIRPVAKTRSVRLGVMEQRDVVRGRRLETVAHVFVSRVVSCPDAENPIAAQVKVALGA